MSELAHQENLAVQALEFPGAIGVSVAILPLLPVARSDARQQAFTAGRCAARIALAQPTAPLPRTRQGAVEWPKGWHGSISHAGGFAAAAVTRHYRCIGIDIEDPARINHPSRWQSRLGSEKEWQLLASLKLTAPQRVTLLLSAKESLYKAFRKTVGRFFGFHAAELVSYTATTLTFRWRIEPFMEIQTQCHWMMYQNRIMTLVMSNP